MKSLMNFVSHSELEALQDNDQLIANGIVLTQQEITALVEEKNQVLESYGRISFSDEVLESIVIRFSESPYIQPSEFIETAGALYEIFHYIKRELEDDVFDDDVLDFMVEAFNGSCGGSLDILGEKEAYTYIQKHKQLWF